MEELIIESNIPAPKERNDWKGLLSNLRYEDSFSFDKIFRQDVANAASRIKKYSNKRFRVSNDPEDATGTKCRVWRIQDAA